VDVAVIWFLLVTLSAAATLQYIRMRYGAWRAEQQLARAVVLIERLCTDALAELNDDNEAPDELYVNAFEPQCFRIGDLRREEVVALGLEIATLHASLTRAMRLWNREAGNLQRAANLLPTILAAREAVFGLRARLNPGRTETLPAAVEHRPMRALVARPPALGAWVH